MIHMKLLIRAWEFGRLLVFISSHLPLSANNEQTSLDTVFQVKHSAAD